MAILEPTMEKVSDKETTQEGPLDLVIIGGGPAGLAAGIYACRNGLKTMLFEKALLGGRITTTEKIENYPGIPEDISGLEIAKRFENQAQKYGLLITWEEVKNFSKSEIITESQKRATKSIIIASGVSSKKLNILGEDKFRGRGVSYCATCDGPFYKEKEVVVVGGGNTAIEEALFLTRFAKKVTVIHRRDKLRADKILGLRAQLNPKIEFLWDSNLIEIHGEKQVKKIKVKNKVTAEIKEIQTEGVFIYIGVIPNTDFLPAEVKKDEYGFILADRNLKTSAEGIFAAGDVCQKDLRQVVTAAADGAIAAKSASEYLESRA